MNFLRQYKFILAFLALLVFCSVMVIQQMHVNQSKHVELREALILLHSGGYTNDARRICLRLERDVPKLSSRELIEDWQRTLTLVDPGTKLPENPVWEYYWVVRKEMEFRGINAIQRARKLAQEE